MEVNRHSCQTPGDLAGGGEWEGYAADAVLGSRFLLGREGLSTSDEFSIQCFLRFIAIPAFCAAIIATCREQIKGLKIATFVSFLAALFCISAMVMFHVVHEMETNTIRLEQFKAGWSSMENHK